MSPQTTSWSARLYRARWLLSVLILGCIVALASGGFSRVQDFSKRVDSLKDNPPAESVPQVFDARYDIWFDPEDPGLQLYKQIEDQFVAEDFVLVAFEERDHPLGVFSPKSLATIAKVTAEIEKIPFVRHVRSLTSNPWIRWDDVGESPETGKPEKGLLITDLFENDTASYDEGEVLRRMIAVLGAKRSAALVGEERVRSALGAEADFGDEIGEPRLVGNVISEDGRTAAFQVQVLRPRLSEEQQSSAFADDAAARVIGRSMHANHSQWSALRGIEAALGKLGGDYKFHYAGMPNIERNFMETGAKDMGMVGFMFITIAVVILVLFRRVTPVVTTMLVVFASIAGMMGTIWLAGDLLNNITAGAPNMVTAISIADTIHLIAAYYLLRPTYTDKAALITEVIRRNGLPVFLTSVTTAIGFFSLTAGNIIPLQMLGYTAGIGALFAYVTSMTLVPAALSVLPLPKTATGNASPGMPAPDKRWVGPLVDAVVAWRKPIAAASLLVVGLAVYGVFRLELDSDFRTMFPDSNVTMVDLDWVESRLGGAGDLEIVFGAPARQEDQAKARKRQSRLAELKTRQVGATQVPQDFAALNADEQAELARLQREADDFRRRRIAIDAVFLGKMRAFTDRLRQEMRDETSPMFCITRLDSALDVLRKMNQVQNENRAAFYRPPEESDVPAEARKEQLVFDEITEEAQLIPAQNATMLTAQYFLQYENGAKPSENLSTLISPDRRTVRVQGRLRQAPSKVQSAAFVRIREIARAEFPELTGSVGDVESGKAISTMTLSGKSLLYAGMTDKFSVSFIRSMALALVVITILIMVIYRSVTIGLLSIVPNVLPIFIPIGFFGLVGWVVDGPAVFVSSVALGICVDDTIHFFTKFTRARRRGEDTRQALRSSLNEVGNALTFTTIILVLGFAVLAFSEFTPNSMMGKLAGVMIALAWVADFIVTPALLTFLPDPTLRGASS